MATLRVERRIAEVQAILTQKLFKVVGLYVSDNLILDEDTFLPIIFKDKVLVYKPMNTMIPIHFDQVLFDPLNKAMVRDLLNIAIGKFIMYEDEYVRMNYLEIENSMKRVIIITDNKKIQTQLYSHEIVCYYDMAIRLACPDLTDYFISRDDEYLLMEFDNLLGQVLTGPVKRNTKRKGIFDDIYG